jgi:hypothetical protein
MLDLEGNCDLAGVEITPSIRALLVIKSAKLKLAADQCLALAMTFYDQRVITELETYAAELEAEAALLQRGLLVTPEVSVFPLPVRRPTSYPRFVVR